MQHECIKCKALYSSDDVDPYLCGHCTKSKIEIAKQIDREFVPRPKAETTLERYDKAKKVKSGFPNANDVL